jgi:ATP-dependent Clp protease ATP-binding subunit ClpC
VFERFTERAREVIVSAQEEARRLGHNYIGTEHVLLGLLRYEDGIPARVLGSFGVTLDGARDQVAKIIGQGEAVTPGQIPFTPRAKKVLELSSGEARRMGHDYIGTEHVLLGLLREGEGVAVRILGEFASPQEIHAEVERTLSGESGTAGARARRPAAPKRLLRRPRPAAFVAPLVLGWLLFALALGVGVLIGWAIWA